MNAVIEQERTESKTTLVPPKLGEYWTGQGGIYAGVARSDDGTSNHYLIVHADEAEDLTFDQAAEWAAKLTADGHGDFTVPTKRESPILYGNVPELFQRDWYWTSTQHASNSDYAWSQLFEYGSQNCWLKDYYTRARAVRRLTI